MHYKKLILFIIALTVLSLGIFSPNSISHAATFDVTDCGDSGMGTFREAIINSNATADPDNVINFMVDCAPVTLASEISITRSVTINGNGFAAILEASGHGILEIDPGTTITINNLAFRNGITSGGGGAIFVAGSNLILNGSSFFNNTADYGGAIFINGGSVSANMTLFFENETQSDPATQLGGAIFVINSELNITNSIFEGNTAILGGAIALDITSSGEITDSTFMNNTAEEGGAIRLTNEDAVTTRIERNTFTQNSATTFGGAIYLSNVLAYINRNTFTENNAQTSGGAITAYSSSAGYISNNIFKDNTGNNEGSGIRAEGGSDLAISHNTFISTQNQIAEFASVVTLDANIFVGGACTGTGIVDDGNNIAHNTTGCPGAAIDPMLDPVSFAPQAGGIEYPAPCHLIVAEDRNGVARPLGSTCTPGAIEVDGTGGTESPVAVVLPPDPFALGCVLTMDVDIAGAPDNTYCRVLMRDGAVIGYSGAVPAELIGLGVQFAVDVYMLDGGRSIVEFPNYVRICLSGSGRLFYLDARNAPRTYFEMTTESVGGATCGWIPASGTLVLTN